MEERERERERESESKGVSSSGLCEDSAVLTPSEPRGTGENSDEDIDKKLDISSEQFDPLLALYSPKVPLPFPNIKCFNNIAEYESFIKGGRGRAKPENVQKRLRKSQRGVADPERIERLKRLMVKNPVEEEGEKGRSRRKQKARKNVLTRMPLHEGSPLGELNRCVQERIRVKVHIRSFKGLRGVCTGFVVAFDKFWNLAMVDVDETYREPLLGEAFYHEKALTVTRLFQKLSFDLKDSGKSAEDTSPSANRTQEHQCGKGTSTGPKRTQTGKSPAAEQAPNSSSEQRTKLPKTKVQYGKVRTRHVNQLFIRGENVLLVNVQKE
ncbi:U7 snRNA-associated Sm-like protein LSm11 [Hoplias malabaricus]|uniref:U7 snRNA-associated Sm-like protein LSm11 n=1 Tax=Hoplias malabaricus TaxID=27720 RepID=UPI0034625DBC